MLGRGEPRAFKVRKEETEWRETLALLKALLLSGQADFVSHPTLDIGVSPCKEEEVQGGI